MLLSNREISKRFDMTIDQVRGAIQAFLSKDANYENGVERMHPPNDVFKLYLIHFMTAKYRLKRKEVQIILEVLWPWLNDKHIIPEPDGDINKDVYEIIVNPIVNGSGFQLKSSRLIDRRAVIKLGQCFITEETAQLCLNDIGMNNRVYLLVDYIIPVSRLLSIFIIKAL